MFASNKFVAGATTLTGRGLSSSSRHDTQIIPRDCSLRPMRDSTVIPEICQMEDRLRGAMLSSNVAELDALIHDQLLFIGPDGGLNHKNDDLDLHRSGQEKLSQVDLIDVQIEPHGSTAVSVVVADMAGTFKGQEFQGRYRYIRTWARTDEGWKVIAGSVCAIDA